MASASLSYNLGMVWNDQMLHKQMWSETDAKEAIAILKEDYNNLITTQ